MPTIGELINNLALKAGIAADNDELKSLLASPELATVQVPETLNTTINNGLLSIEAAKNNHPEIKKKYVADAKMDNDLKLKLEKIEENKRKEEELKVIEKEKRRNEKMNREKEETNRINFQDN